MDRFLSSTINAIDKKGRVSVPASYRSILKERRVLHARFSIEHPAVEAGGPDLIAMDEERLARMDPFSREYEVWSFYLHGEAMRLKIDGDGRIVLGDDIREHTGIDGRVAFVGRGHFFQMWEPGRFKAYRNEARAMVRRMRGTLGSPAGDLAGGPTATDGKR